MLDMTRRSRRKHHGNSNADPTPATINVVLECDNPLKFYLASTSPGIVITNIQVGDGTMQMVTFNNVAGGAPNGFMITFSLSDQTNKGYEFFGGTSGDDPKSAIWVKKATSAKYCPTKKQLAGPFQPQSVDATSLVVKNPNGQLEYFGFALLVVCPTDAQPLILDPVGNNVNGGTGFYQQ